MVYVSSSCIKNDKIIASIRTLHASGFSAVELSGGTKPYSGMEQDLLAARDQLGVDLLLHNYFPPPEVNFVLNLASSNNEVYTMSLEHCKRAIDISIMLGAPKFAFHAGFLIDIKVAEIGKKLSNSVIGDKNEAYDRFCTAYEILRQHAGEDLDLYVENNVFSASNFESFNGVCPLMLTDIDSWEELSSRIDFNLLLDVAHLKVSCQTLGRNFRSELHQMFKSTDYVHVSDNDGSHDTNDALIEESEMMTLLSELNWQGKTVTIEVYDTLDRVGESLNNISRLMNA